MTVKGNRSRELFEPIDEKLAGEIILYPLSLLSPGVDQRIIEQCLGKLVMIIEFQAGEKLKCFKGILCVAAAVELE